MMKLYDFLLKHINKHLNKIAFINNNLTYKELLQIINKKKNDYLKKNKIIICKSKNKIDLAIEILAILASNNIPLIANEKIINSLKEDKKSYQDLAFIVFSSGTTNKEKGIMLSDENIINNILGINRMFSLKNNKKNIIIIRPLIHISALVGELLYSLYKGLSIYFYEDILFPNKINEAINTYNINILGTTPTIFKRIYDYKCDLASLKHVVLSGEILNSKLIVDFYNYYNNITFYNAYGMSENSPRATYIKGNDLITHLNSVGKPLINTKIIIKNNEILIKGKSLMKGYYKNKKLTKNRIINGYFHTKDCGYFKDNYLYVTGRIDNLIIKYGVNIFPEEIEEIVRKYKNVSDCLVYKIKGKDTDLIGLKVVGDVSIDKLKQYLIKNLEAIKIPSEISIEKNLKLTESGKIKRWMIL